LAQISSESNKNQDMGFLDSDSEDSSSSGSGFALRKPVHKATAPAPAPAPAPMPANKQSILDESDSDEDSSDDDSSSTPMRAPAPAPAPVPMPVVVANRSRSSPDDSDSDDSSDGGVPAPKPVPVPTSAPEPTKKKTMLDDSDDSDDDTDDSPRKDGHPEKVAAAATKHETVAESSDVDSNEKNSAGSKTPAAEKDAPAEKPSVAKDEPLDSGKSEGKSDDASLAKEEDAPVNLANNEKDGTDSSQPHAKADISKDSASHEDNVFSTKSSTTKEDAPVNVASNSKDDDADSNKSSADTSERSNADLASDDSLDSNKTPIKIDELSDVESSSENSLDSPIKENPPAEDANLGSNADSFDPPPVQKHEITDDNPASKNSGIDPPPTKKDAPTNVDPKSDNASIESYESPVDPSEVELSSDDSLDSNKSPLKADVPSDSDISSNKSLDLNSENTKINTPQADKCFACGLENEMVPDGLISCSRCKQVPYCSADCLQWHWESHHKAECAGITDTERTSEPAPKIGNQESDTSLDILGSANDEDKQPQSEQGVMVAVAASRSNTAVGPICQDKCVACGMEKEMVPGGLICCSKCQQVPYCSTDCLEWHWESHHKAECTGITDTERTSEPAPKIGNQESDTSLDILGSANDEYKQPHSQQGIMAAVAASRPPTAAGPIQQAKCIACGLEKEMVPDGLISCSKCKQVPYCSTDCLEWHWESHHKAECTGITDTERTSEPASKISQESDTSLDILGSANGEYNHPKSQQGIMAAVAASKYQTITEKPNLTLSESKAATDDEDAPTKIESMLQLHRLEEENCKKEAEIERLRKENSQLKADESRLLEETRQKAVEAAEARIKAQLEEQLKLKEEELLEKSHQVTIDRLVELEALKKSAEASRIAKEEKQEAYAARLAEERRLADEVRLAELAKHKEAALEARLAKEARLEEERIAKQKRELQEKEYDLLERERFAAADAASREAILRPARLATARLDRRAERFRKEEEEERRAKVKGEEERSMLAMMEEDKMESLEKERLAVERAAARERDVESLASSSDLDRAKAARDADVWAEEVKDLSSASTFDFSDPVSDPREQIQDDRGNLEECLESFRLNNLVELLDVELPTRLSEGNAARMQQLTKILSNNRFVKEVSIVVPSRMESSLSRHSDLSTMFEAIGSLQNLKELNIISSSAGATKNTRSSLSSRFINSALCKIAHMHKTKNRGYVQKEGGLVSLSIANMVLVDTHADLTHLVDSLEIINQIPTLKTAQVEIEFTS